MTKEIYVIMEGEYSDRRIVDIYDDEKIAKLATGEDMWMETWELNRHIDKLKQGLRFWYVEVAVTGKIKYCYQQSPNFDYIGFHDRFRSYYTKAGGTTRRLITHIWAKNKKHAKKMANRKRSHYINLGKWGANI